MRRLDVVKIIVIVGMLLAVGFSSDLAANANDSYVEVKLKNGNIKKLEYDTFSLSWLFPITVISPMTCDEVIISKDEIEEIYVVGEFSNNCDDNSKDDWEFTVYLTQGREMLGFFKVSDFSAKGKLYGSGQDISIPFRDIKKVSFRRQSTDQ